MYAKFQGELYLRMKSNPLEPRWQGGKQKFKKESVQH
jgi:hypothetical protein